ncbi:MULTISPECIES: feruloyl-CoA synthase [Maribacter]|uniref:Feruloyl-CoA synthase n=1 Tax=Maribacter flavus TaxID=1658664 RepID=A0ABU7IKT4_9FLAO|nr:MULTISPECIES: feruloyl-CoA synthase [Maribacter]MDC6406286.1 feruloyl-CoA synthase [Maribacter sp. PR66]MEE1973406.1 feruloyl-CoA synthase [Maribacter flavus]
MSEQTWVTDNIPYLEVPTISVDIERRVGEKGVNYLKSKIPLGQHPKKITERLQFWAHTTPNAIFLAQREDGGEWRTLTYMQAWQKIQGIAQYLLETVTSKDRPIALLSGNSIEHGLLALAAMHIGIPYAPISPAYSLKSDSFDKLKHCLDVLDPELIFVQDGNAYKKALDGVASNTRNCRLVFVENGMPESDRFEDIVKTKSTPKVAEAYDKIGRDTLAKVLFTSGSTGLPKGVMNTHGNLTANWQQITQTFPFVQNGALQLMDWLPWNHTFGSNHNFGLVMYNGGSLYIDEGSPTPTGMAQSIKNLKDFAPTVYFNVPKGFEELIPFLNTDEGLRQTFFSRLKMLFYGGASISQKVWDELERLSIQTTGKRILISSGFGMTESSPSAMFCTAYDSKAGFLGVPVPGLEMKLVPMEDRWEARFKGPNITPGYWKNQVATVNAFDREGFYKTSEALKFIDEHDPNVGMRYDGRIAEDFKLSTGTWVNVGNLRDNIIAQGKGLVKDVVITGHDQDFVGAVLFLNLGYCADFLGGGLQTTDSNAAHSLPIRDCLQEMLDTLAQKSTGSSTKVRRAIIADFELSPEKGEITEKGSINQYVFLKHRSSLVAKLYGHNLEPGILETNY